MKDSTEDNCRGVPEDDEAKSKITALRWYCYTEDIPELINILFLFSVFRPKEGNIFWTHVKKNIIRK